MYKLIICDTLFQIIVAIQMKITLFQNDTVDLWISDHSIGVDSVTERLRKQKLFESITYIKTKDLIYLKNRFKKLVNTLQFGLGKKQITQTNNYNEIIFYSTSEIIYCISNIYRRRKFNTTWSRFEEGILSYETDFVYGNSVKILEKILTLFNRNIVTDEIKKYYCFFPELKKTNRQWRLIKIPDLSANEAYIKSILIDAFGFEEKPIKQKFIYFASSSDIDGYPYGETELILKISNIVGKDNLIVKKHPRDDRDVFDKHGIAVLDSIGIPWEIFQMSSYFQNKILLTVDSGAFLGITAMLNSQIRGLFLFPYFEGKRRQFNERDKNLSIILHELQKLGRCRNIKVSDDINSLKEIDIFDQNDHAKVKN